MSYWAPAGATLAIAANATSGTVLGDMSAYPVTPGMVLAPGSRSGIDGPTRIITSWTPTTSPVGATFTIDGAFSGSVAFAAGTPFIIDNLATPGSVLAQNNLAVSNLLNGLKKWFGLSTTLDQNSKSLPFNRAAGAGTFTELVFQLADRKWFGWEHRTISGIERLLGRTYVDGSTATDTIDINGSDGTVDYRIGEATRGAAATVNLGTDRARKVVITGTANISSFGSTPNLERILRFTGAPTIVHNATSLVVPGGANVTVAAGDTMRVTSDASGNWRVLSWTRASGSVPFAALATTAADGIMAAADKKKLDGVNPGTNLVPNGYFVAGLSGWTTAALTTGAFSTLSNDGTAPAGNKVRLTLNGQNTGNPRIEGERFPLVPDRQYYLGGWTRASAAATATSHVLRINWVKNDGSSASTALNSLNVTAGTTWAWSEVYFTAPADAVYGFFTFLGNAANASADGITWLDATGFEVKEVIESTRLIKDGTLTNALMAPMVAGSIKGRGLASDGAPSDLTPGGARVVIGLSSTDKPNFAGVNLTGPMNPRAYTVNTLPTAGNALWDVLFASNCRTFNGAGTQEGAGNGTGALVFWNGTNWKIVGTNVTAIS